MKLALVQMDPVIGDFSGNTSKICTLIERARQEQCDLVIFPEMALLGYPPRDLLDKPSFVRDSKRYWEAIRLASRGIGVILGVVDENTGDLGKPYYNSALFFSDGEALAIAHKQLLPSYDVFDEDRYFDPGERAVWVDFKGRRLGLTICEDVWNVEAYLPHHRYRRDPVGALAEASTDVLITISASPFHTGKSPWVADLLRGHARQTGMQVVYVNQVGGNDELIFQGHSMVFDESGEMVARGADFEEDFLVYDTEARRGDIRPCAPDTLSETLGALVFGLREYARKCGFEKFVLGLSGGIDSALTACVAALAFGPEQVLCVAMPGPYNAPESLDDARELAQRLGTAFQVVPIGDLFEASRRSLAPAFADLPEDVTEENIQARLRGLILMAISNKFNRLLLSTGNKSEMAVGYCTLYGDTNGGLAVLGDVPKTLVYELAHLINRDHDWIPQRIITRPPSAELSPDQEDQDTLPPYEVLDGILAAYVEDRLAVDEIIARGWDPDTVRWVVRRVVLNEYKRWQAPPILRVTSKAFGSGRRCPIAHRYREYLDS